MNLLQNYYSNSPVAYYLIHEWCQTITIVNTIMIIVQPYIAVNKNLSDKIESAYIVHKILITNYYSHDVIIILLFSYIVWINSIIQDQLAIPSINS